VNNEPPIRPEAGRATLSRRELAQNLLTGLAAGILVPSLPSLHPIRALLQNGMLLDSSDEILAMGNYRPVFLTAAQLASVDKMTEALVPGSRKAQSASFIDLLLSVDSAKSQQAFVDFLSTFETAAQHMFHKGIVALTNTQLNKLLNSATAKESSSREHFENLKGWAVGAYYSSEIGMRELGWTPDRVFSTFPVCTHAENHS